MEGIVYLIIDTINIMVVLGITTAAMLLPAHRIRQDMVTWKMFQGFHMIGAGILILTVILLFINVIT